MKMKYQINQFIFGVIIIISGICASSCNKVLEVDSPPYEISITDSYKDDGTATSAVMGIYAQITGTPNKSPQWGGLTLYSSEWTAELFKTNTNGVDDFLTGQLNDRTVLVSSMWTQSYATMLAINTAIIQLNAATALTPAIKSELLGECYFMRAYIYFNLVNLWGSGTALTLSVTLTDNRIAASTPAVDTYNQIIKDLKIAQNLLPTTDIAADRGRPNKFAATALLAKTYLYLGQYSDAAAQAKAVIGSSNFSLPAPAAVFTKTSKEIIWALVPAITASTNTITPDGYNFVPAGSITPPTFQLSPDLYNAFENGDLRKSSWVLSKTVTRGAISTTYLIPGKYTVSTTTTPAAATQSYIVLRLAEQYLVLAEANYKLNNNAGAVTNLNIIRARAGLPALSSMLSAEQVRAAIEQENRIEFFVEQGHRFFDLKRWPGLSNPALTRADELLPALKPSWTTYNDLWPLPYADLTVDANLKQNPGYAIN